MTVAGRQVSFVSLDAAAAAHGAAHGHLPVCLKMLLENLLRNAARVPDADRMIRDLFAWAGPAEGDFAFFPERVVMPDSSGIPVLADLTAMREAMVAAGGDPLRIQPAIPVDLVLDHSVTAEAWGNAAAFERNLLAEYDRNAERYAFAKWAGGAYRNLRIVPPGAGIVHQVNIEYLAHPVRPVPGAPGDLVAPDSLVGLDSHTPMINALGVVGWGVGGIEAAVAMLGQPLSLAIPDIVGCRLTGERPAGVSGADIVLHVTERLRQAGVTGSFVEFFGAGVRRLSLTDRATISNMAPEYGATMGFFAPDDETLRYLAFTGRPPEEVALAGAYWRRQGLWADESYAPVLPRVVEIDLAGIATSMAGPRRPQDRRNLAEVPGSFDAAYGLTAPRPAGPVTELADGSVVLAAITSCTNTSNSEALVTAGLLARNARGRGLRLPDWVKASFSPGSRVTADYLAAAGLQEHLDALGFHLIGFGCMTCGGGAGPLAPEVERQIRERNLTAAAVLSANRNFEGRIHALVKGAYIGAPALVIAYALAGTVRIDLDSQPLGHDPEGRPVLLRDIWPPDAEIAQTVAAALHPGMFRDRYAEVFRGDHHWQGLTAQSGPLFRWNPDSTYLLRPPFLQPDTVARPGPIRGARALLLLGDGVTTDHISPVNPIPADSPAGQYLRAQGVGPARLHSYLARRVNHEVMARGTFANPRVRNLAVPGSEGGIARHQPSGEVGPVHDIAMRYRAEGTPVVVVAGRDYGTGSSRDWAAKGTLMLGVAAVIADSFERIHRSNLVGMGVLPVQLAPDAPMAGLGLDGGERFSLELPATLQPRQPGILTIDYPDGRRREITVVLRLDTPTEIAWYAGGGILPFVLGLAAPARAR